MNEQPYFCCGQLPSEGHTAQCAKRHGWNECATCGEDHDSDSQCPMAIAEREEWEAEEEAERALAEHEASLSPRCVW